MSSGPALVFDNGADTSKIGLAGDDHASKTFPTLLSESGVGAAAIQGATWRHPIKKGEVANWEDMEKIWSHSFNELKVNQTEYRVLLGESPISKEGDKLKSAEIFFEKFNVPAMARVSQSVLALYGSGRMTGLVVDSGYDVTTLTGVVDGYAVTESLGHFDVAGSQLDDCLVKLLAGRQYHASSLDVRENVRNMKESLCFVAQDFKGELAAPAGDLERMFNMSGGPVAVGVERFKCPEIYFQPTLIGLNSVGLPKIITTTIGRCEMDIRKDFYGAIIFVGGSTLFPGLSERLQHEITSLAPSAAKVKVIALPERRNASWTGGSTLAASDNFRSRWVTKQDYDESGAAAITKKL